MLVLAALPGLALAGTQGSCQAGDTSKVRLYENSSSDNSDNDDSMWKCGNDNNLDSDPHTLPGNCNGAIFDATTWNDCVTSVAVWVPTGWCINFYMDAGYDALMPNSTVEGPASGTRITLQYNDQLSSFLFYEC